MNAFVSGRPALFLTTTEREWRVAVGRSAVADLQHPWLEFTVADFLRGGQEFDIDILAKPALEVVAPSPATVRITVVTGDIEGVRIRDEEPPRAERVDLEVEVAEPRRRSVKPVPPVPELANMGVLGTPNEPLGLELTFDSNDERIGDFGFTGPIKPLIDSLGQVLGTYRLGARDYRIRELRIRRGAKPRGIAVRVRLWLLGGHAAG